MFTYVIFILFIFVILMSAIQKTLEPMTIVFDNNTIETAFTTTINDISLTLQDISSNLNTINTNIDLF